ncbi:hypothetical protein A45J_0472 [hot springs metagenome]|uniref:Uncharacterized protein n=1 Tax=hot springs metagenome TaxID=433727 RepID=A0A5J4L1V5_9ZZZZ
MIGNKQNLFFSHLFLHTFLALYPYEEQDRCQIVNGCFYLIFLER